MQLITEVQIKQLLPHSWQFGAFKKYPSRHVVQTVELVQTLHPNEQDPQKEWSMFVLLKYPTWQVKHKVESVHVSQLGSHD